jgi:hypothetical protein
MSQFDLLKQKGAYLKADSFDDALIGFVWPLDTGVKVAVYDRNKCIEILQEGDGMSEEDAIEFFEFNVSGAYVGPQTPMFVDRCGES